MAFAVRRLTTFSAVHSNNSYIPRLLFTTQAQQPRDRWPEKIPKEFISKISDKYNLDISNAHNEEYQSLVGGMRDHWTKVDKWYEHFKQDISPDITDRTYKIPAFNSSENKYGQWACLTDIKPTNPNGPLKGKKIGIKDSVFVAGIPCLNGSELFKDCKPTQDATVVKRILDAGGTIIGKTQCENLCYSGGSHTSYPNPVQNPHNPLHHAGGSSSGSSCAVAIGDCDMAIGGDQGGSVRLPSSWCGTVGFKATYGVVPYTGAHSIDAHFDHLGPITKTVQDAVDFLKVIAGKDGYDLRQINAPNHNDTQFISSLDTAMTYNNINDIKIGLVNQAFNDCEAETAESVKNAVEQLKAKKVVDLDIPIHDDIISIWCSIGISGQFLTMYLNGGLPALPRGKYDDAVSKSARDGFENGLMKYSQTNITNIIAGEWMFKEYGSMYYARGTELSRCVANEYEKLMDKHDLDVLIYPTIKYTAPELPINPSDMTPSDCSGHAFSNVANTMTSSVTGHPTLQIPVKESKINGLPIGMSIIARNNEDAKCVHVAQVYEKLRGPLKDL